MVLESMDNEFEVLDGSQPSVDEEKVNLASPEVAALVENALSNFDYGDDYEDESIDDIPDDDDAIEDFDDEPIEAEFSDDEDDVNVDNLFDNI